jgi:hypothetical protein
MNLVESLEYINYKLGREFGKFDDGRQFFRVVFTEDQYEMQHGNFIDRTSSGIFIREVTETRQVKKYPWIKEKYILEGLRVIPVENMNDLPGTKLSYEPVWVFEDKNQKYLPPKMDVCRIVIDQIRRNQEGGQEIKKHPMAGLNTKEQIQAEKERIDKLAFEMFGQDETDIGDALMTKQAIIVPGRE